MVTATSDTHLRKLRNIGSTFRMPPAAVLNIVMIDSALLFIIYLLGREINLKRRQILDSVTVRAGRF